MIDETDLSQEEKWFHEERAKTVVASLNRKSINAQYVSSKQEALSAVLEMIPEGVKVVRGDSMSVDQVGVIEELTKRNKNTVVDPFARDAEGHSIHSREGQSIMFREAFTSQIFMTGTNAVTLDGKLVNVDALGNRVAAMIYGPEKVLLIAGVNKIVKDVHEALERIRNYAAPINAKRHYLKHHSPEVSDLPCVRTGKCTDCNHEWRICNNTVIIEGTWVRAKRRINVVLVGEELGI